MTSLFDKLLGRLDKNSDEYDNRYSSHDANDIEKAEKMKNYALNRFGLVDDRRNQR